MEPTSNSARKSAPKTRSAKSGDDYLADQISDARLALESTLDDLTLDLAHAADLRRWVRRYPWAALGTALVAGFTLGHVVTRSKQQPDDGAPADNTSSSPQPSGDATAASSANSSIRQQAVGGWRTAMISALFDILRLAVTQFISASVRQAASHDKSARPSPPEN